MRTTLLKIELACLAALLFFAGPVLRAEPPAGTMPHPPDLLSEALPLLQAKYPDFKALQFKKGDRLSDLIARSNGKISLRAPENGTSAVSVPIVTADLPDNIIYWRLASFTPEKSWMEMGTRLEQASGTAAGMILDLRGNVAPDDYHGAAQVLGLFAASDPTLMRFQADGFGDLGVRVESRYSFHSPIVVLTNKQTTGAAEALAACLQADGALVVGRPTAGKMGVFEEQKLSSGQVMRYFVSPVCPMDPNAVFKIQHHFLSWNQLVTPDIGVAINDQAEKSALLLIEQHGVLEVIHEASERRRMSEATLVQGEDPEWDDYLASREKKPNTLPPTSPPVQDVVLINALDSLKAIRLSQSHAASPSGEAALPEASSSVR